MPPPARAAIETYRPYGERLNNQPASSENPIWYTGKRQDAETGLVYMGSRYYDPRLGRFLSIDPVEPDENNLHSLNRYAYANNNPYKFTDPDGQNPFLILVAFGMEMINLANSDGPPGGGLTRTGANAAGKLATKGEEVTQTVKQAADRGVAKAGEKANEVAKAKNFAGGQSREQRLRDLARDDKVSGSDRGWIKQEMNEVSAGKKGYIRNPPGKDLAHERGRENAKGYGYEHAHLQNRADHRTQHKLDNWGRANKERPLQ